MKKYVYLICPPDEKSLIDKYVAVLDEAGYESLYDESLAENTDSRLNKIYISACAVTCGDTWMGVDSCITDMRYALRKNIPLLVGESVMSVVDAIFKIL